jgi:hypothetical protein
MIASRKQRHRVCPKGSRFLALGDRLPAHSRLAWILMVRCGVSVAEIAAMTVSAAMLLGNPSGGP